MVDGSYGLCTNAAPGALSLTDVGSVHCLRDVVSFLSSFVPAYKGSLAGAKGACNQTKLVNKFVNWRRKHVLELSSEAPNAEENHALLLL
eukprot:1145020-Pelagomonas_calceolata.AAC.8